MENVKKPLRSSQNAQQDIYDVYVKGNKEREIEIETEDQNIDDKIEAALANEQLDNDAEEKNSNEQGSLESEPAHDEKTDEELNTLQSSIESYKKEIDSLKENLARRTAEMENMKKRTEKEKSDLVSYANAKLLTNLLEIPDTISQALDASNKSEDYQSLKKGVEMIHSKTIKLFEEAGVQIMEDPTGKEFDVELHEALMIQPSEDVPEGNVVQVVQNGYILKDRVLRHAKVITSSGKG